MGTAHLAIPIVFNYSFYPNTQQLFHINVKRQIKTLPEPFVQLRNIRVTSPARQSSSLAHCAKKQQQLCILHWLDIHNKSHLMLCFLNCPNLYLITFYKLHKLICSLGSVGVARNKVVINQKGSCFCLSKERKHSIKSARVLCKCLQ